MDKILKKIFSIKNEQDKKVLMVFGIKFKFRNKYQMIKKDLCKLEILSMQNNTDIESLQNEIHRVKEQCLTNRNILSNIDKPFLYNTKEWEYDYIVKFNSDMKKFDLKTKYRELIKNLDDKSIKTINNIVSRCKIVGCSNEQYFEIFSHSEMKKIVEIMKIWWQKRIQLSQNCWAYEKYYLPINWFEICVFVEKHGIEIINKEYFSDKDIIDAGAFIGDSAIVLSDYTSKNVHSFEPTKKNYKLLQETIELNDKTNIIPINTGLGATDENIEIAFNDSASGILNVKNTTQKETCNIITLDKYVQENDLQIGLIKTDLEGYEQQFLKGAENTIKTQKPTLLISIYHTADDFFNIKPLIESWNLGYKFKVVKPLDGQILLETILIAEVEPKMEN